MIDVCDVTVTDGCRRLVAGVSFQVGLGEVVGVVGPNGAGKSTLLGAVAGYRSCLGRVSLGGRPLHAWDRVELARRRSALLQSTTLSFGFSASEGVLLGRTPHRGGGRSLSDYEIAQAALEEVGALHLAARAFQKLSGGEQQRVQLARALAQIWEDGDTRYLLLDEPTAALDIRHQHRVLATARGFAKRGAAVLVVLHDLNLAARYTDRVLVLRDGEASAYGPPEETLGREVVSDVFGVEVRVVRDPTISDRPYLVDLGPCGRP